MRKFQPNFDPKFTPLAVACKKKYFPSPHPPTHPPITNSHPTQPKTNTQLISKSAPSHLSTKNRMPRSKKTWRVTEVERLKKLGKFSQHWLKRKSELETGVHEIRKVSQGFPTPTSETTEVAPYSHSKNASQDSKAEEIGHARVCCPRPTNASEGAET